MYASSLLAPVSQLQLLANEALFPATASQLEHLAHEHHSRAKAAQFVAQFSPDTLFRSRSDFLNRCDDLELIHEQALGAPPEILRSPQD